ncbi:TetR/AcrR family transcriptional regulator [Dictyobacter kobayashii]|uniref:TetR/AcrR family transcriptional regulator n=1 Tax=Dictyobacter kobayashii TaxID=2014872 RepID=UPI000F82401C
MAQLELLTIEAAQIPLLATNIWIINRYWIDYCQTRSPSTRSPNRTSRQASPRCACSSAPTSHPPPTTSLN